MARENEISCNAHYVRYVGHDGATAHRMHRTSRHKDGDILPPCRPPSTSCALGKLIK